MTAIVGILCQNGVVLGTDSSATFGSGQIHTVEQPMQKLNIVGDSVIFAGTGQVGLGQRFHNIVEESWRNGTFNKTATEVSKHLSKLTIEDFGYTYTPKGQYGALVAFPAKGTFHLCEFAVEDFQPEFKTAMLWYVSLGVTQHITDSFLALMREVFWKTGPPSLSGGLFVATWTLDHAIDVNVGGVKGPIQIAVLSKGTDGQLKAEIIPDASLGEHRQNINSAKKALRDYCESLQKPKEVQVPNIPRLNDKP
jgi:hypothetical protein